MNEVGDKFEISAAELKKQSGCGYYTTAIPLALVLGVALLVGGVVLVNWVTQSSRAAQLFTTYVGVPTQKVKNLQSKGSDKAIWDGYWEIIFHFDYETNEATDHVIKEYHLENAPPSTASSGSVPFSKSWNYSHAVEYFTETHYEHGPVVEMWIDRRLMKCCVRFAASY
jgi:hypothetical protein